MEPHPPTTTRQLERGDGPVAGVAAGLADYFDVDPTLVRLGLVATTLITGPAIPLVYAAAWIIVPRAEEPAVAPAPPCAPWVAAPPAPADTSEPVAS